MVCKQDYSRSSSIFLLKFSSSAQDGCPDASLTALFTFVARDPVTRRSMTVNPLEPETAAQKAIFAERQALADARKAARQQGAGGGSSQQGALMQSE